MEADDSAVWGIEEGEPVDPPPPPPPLGEPVDPPPPPPPGSLAGLQLSLPMTLPQRHTGGQRSYGRHELRLYRLL
eukprot:SAG22_NODE_10945_length_508_cov_1.036675_2_plen_74_part_01